MRGLTTVRKHKPDLEKVFAETRRGIVNVPAVLQGVPDKELEEFGLEHYEVSPVEPLHDVKGHLINIIDEIRVSVTGEV